MQGMLHFQYIAYALPGSTFSSFDPVGLEQLQETSVSVRTRSGTRSGHR
jgi:hypothetical protein